MSILKKTATALLAACAASIGTTLGSLASDAIKARLAPPKPKRKKGSS